MLQPFLIAPPDDEELLLQPAAIKCTNPAAGTQISFWHHESWQALVTAQDIVPHVPQREGWQGRLLEVLMVLVVLA